MSLYFLLYNKFKVRIEWRYTEFLLSVGGERHAIAEFILPIMFKDLMDVKYDTFFLANETLFELSIHRPVNVGSQYHVIPLEATLLQKKNFDTDYVPANLVNPRPFEVSIMHKILAYL